jgi:hypothetical protein
MEALMLRRTLRTPLARRLVRVGMLALTVASCVLPAGAASAQGDESADGATSPEQQLAERYAPVVMLKTQEEECDRDGEGYTPMAVDSLFDNPQIALRQVGNDDPVVMWAPSARDIFRLKKGFYLDFPGGSLARGCIFERDFRAITADGTPAVYAHVVVLEDRPEELVLQYWFFWYFNDWNNTHGRLGLMQLVFPASRWRKRFRQPSSAVTPSTRGRAGRLDRRGSTSRLAPHRLSSAGSHAATSGPLSTWAATAVKGLAATTPTVRQPELTLRSFSSPMRLSTTPMIPSRGPRSAVAGASATPVPSTGPTVRTRRVGSPARWTGTTTCGRRA